MVSPRVIACLVLCIGLAGVAIWLEAQLWAVPIGPTIELTPFWWLLGVGVVFAALVWYGGLEIVGRASTSDGPASVDRPSTRDRWSLAMLLIAVVAEVASLALFWGGVAPTQAWLVHLFAVGQFLVAIWGLYGAGQSELVPGWSRLDTVLVSILAVLALIPRVWQIGTMPRGIWFDEAQRGLEAFRILAEPTYRPIFAANILQEPTGLWYLMAPLLAWLGRDPVALRLPVAIGGTVGIVAIYLLGMALFGRRVAIVAAALAIGLTLHLNFSRIALPAILSVTCDTLAAALFVLGLRRGNRFLLGSAGVACGAGFFFYYTSQLMPFVLAAVAGQQLLAGGRDFLRRNLVGLLLCALGFLIATGPIVEYAVLNPDQFKARAGTVSIFNEVDRTGSWDPLIENVKVHFLMFNVKGDPNGRHNWSGRPMLDPVTGGLAIAGLCLVLLRARGPGQTLVRVWLPAALAGGIFSLSFEAPQSHRSIGAIVPAILLGALPLAVLWAGLDRVMAGWRTRPSLPTTSRLGRVWAPAFVARESWYVPTCLIAVLVLLGTDAMNISRFFNSELTDGRTWGEFSTPQTEAGRQIAALPSNTRIYLEPAWVNYPTINFLVGQPRPYAPFDPAVNLPIVDPTAAIFIADRVGEAEQIAHLYPDALRTYTRIPESPIVAGYGFVLTEQMLEASRGVDAHYAGAAGTVERRERSLDLPWPTGAPLAAPFDATFATTLTVPTFGAYQFSLDGPPSATLTLDGVDVTTGGRAAAIRLARGNHALRLSGTGLGDRPIRLLWSNQTGPLQPVPPQNLNVSPVEATGLLGRIYRGEGVSGDAVTEQVDPQVDLRVHTLPLPRPYTIDWTGSIRIDKPAQYQFGVGSIGASTIWIDDVQLAHNEVENGYSDAAVVLAQGWHDIRVRFTDRQNFAGVTAFWQPPDGPREAIPARVLRPWPPGRIAAARPEDADLPAAAEVVAADDTPRLTPIAPPDAPVPADALVEIGTIGAGGSVGQPRGIARGPDGTVYVADGARRVVVAVAPDGSTRLLGEGELKDPSAVAVLPDGGLVVLDAGAGAVFRLSPDGSLGQRLLPSVPMYGPRGLSISPTGQLVIADTGDDRVLVGPPDGPFEPILGLSQPTSAAMLADGSFLIAETGANRLAQITMDGRRLATWTMMPSTTVVGPQLTSLPSGGWAVTSPEAHAVVVRRSESVPVEIRGIGGATRRPTGVTVDASGHLIVADADAGVLRVFQVP